MENLENSRIRIFNNFLIFNFFFFFEQKKPAIRSILNEIKQLKKKPLEDIEVIVSEDDLTSIYAIITGPKDTPFEAGRFKIKLSLGSEFPKVPPKGYFITKIFHPNVSEKGEICVNTLKKDWKEDLGIQHILIVKTLFFSLIQKITVFFLKKKLFSFFFFCL